MESAQSSTTISVALSLLSTISVKIYGGDRTHAHSYKRLLSSAPIAPSTCPLESICPYHRPTFRSQKSPFPEPNSISDFGEFDRMSNSTSTRGMGYGVAGAATPVRTAKIPEHDLLNRCFRKSAIMWSNLDWSHPSVLPKAIYLQLHGTGCPTSICMLHVTAAPSDEDEYGADCPCNASNINYLLLATNRPSPIAHCRSRIVSIT